MVALLVSLGSLRAQSASRAGDSATTVRRGAIRITFGGSHQTQHDRYRDGALEPLGAPLAATALGPDRFPLLGSIEAEVRALGLPAFAASLGTSRLDARQRLFVTPLAVEYGLTEWLTIGVRASLVRTKTEALFRLRGDSGRASLGPNPINLGTSVPSANATTIGAYSLAAQSLTSRRDACIANPGSAPECPTILAEAAAVTSLIGLTSAFASGLTTLYGAGLIGGAPYVPLAGSAAEAALLQRVDSLRLALVRYGVTAVTSTTGLPLGAQAPLASEDLSQLITDPVRGFGAKRLNDGALTALGDVQFSALVRLHDGLRCTAPTPCPAVPRGFRQSLLIGVQLGSGARPRVDRLLDQGTGSGFNAVSVRSLTDIALGERFGASLSIGATAFARENVRMRVPSVATQSFLEGWRDAVVPVTPGLALDIGVAPRWRVTETFTLGAQWQVLRQADGRHEIDSATVDPRGATVLLSGAALDALSGTVEERAGITASYSMLPAIGRGLRRPPIEISYAHVQTMFGHQGIVPKHRIDQIQFRYYTRFLGR